MVSSHPRRTAFALRADKSGASRTVNEAEMEVVMSGEHVQARQHAHAPTHRGDSGRPTRDALHLPQHGTRSTYRIAPRLHCYGHSLLRLYRPDRRRRPGFAASHSCSRRPVRTTSRHERDGRANRRTDAASAYCTTRSVRFTSPVGGPVRTAGDTASPVTTGGWSRLDGEPVRHVT
jgi:hypothetical protein